MTFILHTKRERCRKAAAFFVDVYTRHQKVLCLRQLLRTGIEPICGKHLRRRDMEPPGDIKDFFACLCVVDP